jgi:DNA-binding CsgD family transcriptional regulator
MYAVAANFIGPLPVLNFFNCLQMGGVGAHLPLMEMRDLTAAELKALSLFATGSSSQQIAEKLGVHQSLVLGHLRVATRKLGAANHVHAVMIATELKLIRSMEKFG